MQQTALDLYLSDVDTSAAPALRALDGAVRDAGPDLAAAIKYRLLMYALHDDWRHWVCAINATKKGVCLRFLYGVLLDDPLGVLRAGTSTLMTWDLGLDQEIDATAVGGYVAEAVRKYDAFKADAGTISEASRAAAKEHRRKP